MANVLYEKGRQAFLQGDIDWLVDDIRGIIVDAADYTQDLANHDALNDIAAGARVAVTTAFTAKDATNGVANATIPLLTAVTGDPCEYFIVYKHTGTESTSLLIASYDISYTPTGNDLQIAFSTGANKAFKL